MPPGTTTVPVDVNWIEPGRLHGSAMPPSPPELEELVVPPKPELELELVLEELVVPPVPALEELLVEVGLTPPVPDDEPLLQATKKRSEEEERMASLRMGRT